MMLLQKLFCCGCMSLRHVGMRRIFLIFFAWRGRRFLFLTFLKFFLFFFCFLNNLFFLNIHLVINVFHAFNKFLMHFLFMTKKFKILVWFFSLVIFVCFLEFDMNDMFTWLINHFTLMIDLFWLLNFLIKVLMNDVFHWNRIILKNLLFQCLFK